MLTHKCLCRAHIWNEWGRSDRFGPRSPRYFGSRAEFHSTRVEPPVVKLTLVKSVTTVKVQVIGKMNVQLAGQKVDSVRVITLNLSLPC